LKKYFLLKEESEMSKPDVRPEGKLDSQSMEKEKRRTSHWLFSRRGPAFLDRIFRYGDPALHRVKPYINSGQKVADIGCGWGAFSVDLADIIGAEGKVYAVDLSRKCVDQIRMDADRRGYTNIEAHAASAADLTFIEDRSVDFVFANGLLCSMAIGRQAAVAEIKRILKPSGYAYLSLGMRYPFGYVSQDEWESIISGFKVQQGGAYREKWALVSLKEE
jgi:ubiquinone/menaquinone biosynthesis C-methylase UbiE